MKRLQTLLAALISIIENYHDHQCGDKALISSHKGVNSAAIIMNEETSELTTLIAHATLTHKKRVPLLHYILATITLIKPLTDTRSLLEDNEIQAIRLQLEQFVLTMQLLLKQPAKNHITVRYHEQEVALCGLMNGFLDGGGMSTSGALIRDSLFPALFSYLESPTEAKPQHINQVISDILNEHQLACIKPLYRYITYTNTTLNSEICTRGDRIRSLEHQVEMLQQPNMLKRQPQRAKRSESKSPRLFSTAPIHTTSTDVITEYSDSENSLDSTQVHMETCT